MSPESNRKLIHRYYSDLLNEWNSQVADEIIAEDGTFRGSLAVTVQTRDGFKRYVNLVRSAFPDFDNALDDLVSENDKVVARLTHTGIHHKDELFGIAPTNTRVTYAGVAIFNIKQEQIVDGWVIGDTLSLLRQLDKQTVPPI